MASVAQRSYGLWTVVILTNALLALTFFLMVFVPAEWFDGRPRGATPEAATDGRLLRLFKGDLLFNSQGAPIPDLQAWLRMQRQRGHDPKERIQIIASRDATYGELRKVVEILQSHGVEKMQVQIDDAVLTIEPPPQDTEIERPPICVKVLADHDGFANGLLCGETICESWLDLREKLRAFVEDDAGLGLPPQEIRAEVILPHGLILRDVALAYLVVKGEASENERATDLVPKPLIRHVNLFPSEEKLDFELDTPLKLLD